jgi:polyphosphate glucokinase
MQQELILGIDVGATGLKGGLVDVRTGEMIGERFRIKTPKPAAPKTVTEVFCDVVKHFDWKGNIGVGFPSVIRNGVIKTAANIEKDWIGMNVEEHFEKACGCKVFGINDADAAGIAELYFGAADGQNGSTIMLTLGTGIGSAMFLDGVLVPNTEFGHLKMEDDMVAEKYCSDGIRKKTGMTWDEYGKRLNRYIKHLDRIFSPDLIILGGGGSKEFASYQDFLKTPVKVITAQKLNSAGIIGAAYYAYHKANHMSLKGVID